MRTTTKNFRRAARAIPIGAVLLLGAACGDDADAGVTDAEFTELEDQVGTFEDRFTEMEDRIGVLEDEVGAGVEAP